MEKLGITFATTYTTNGRTRTPDEISQLAINKIISVADNVPEVLKSQTLAYKENIRKVIAYYVNSAIQEEKIACAFVAETNNAKELAQAIRNR